MKKYENSVEVNLDDNEGNDLERARFIRSYLKAEMHL